MIDVGLERNCRAGSSWDFLSEDPARDRRNLKLVMETVGELYGELGAEERMRRAVDRAVLVTEAERGFLLIEDGGELKTRVVRDAAGSDLPLGERYSRAIVQEAWETGNPVFRLWSALPPDVSMSDTIPQLHLQSTMAMRLCYEGRLLGVLYVDATSHTKDFTTSENRVFLALGGLVATALANARLEAESIERMCMARRLHLAREVQRRLLPRRIRAPEGLDVAGTGHACHELAGDYFDVIERPDGRLAIAMGDVSGHNISAALHMMTTRAVVRQTVGRADTPASALSLLNGVLEQDMRPCDFMSLFLGVLDPATRELTYASAGHNPPLLRRSDGRVLELGGTGPVLNVIPQTAYGTAGPIPLEAGDVLFLYTDGLTEGRAPDGELWSESRLRSSLDLHARTWADAAGILSGVLSDATAFRQGQPLQDDITALTIRLRAPARA